MIALHICFYCVGCRRTYFIHHCHIFKSHIVHCVWNVMAHVQKPDFVFWRNGQVHLNWRGRQLSRLLAAEVYASVVVMLDTPCSEVVWRVLATHSIRQFPLYFPSRASPCAIIFQLDSTETCSWRVLNFTGLIAPQYIAFHLLNTYIAKLNACAKMPWRSLLYVFRQQGNVLNF
jgi:hypothetical protein